MAVWILGGLGAATYLILLRTHDPAAAPLFPKCLVHSLTGLQCPGCGSQRALHQLLNGHVVGALHANVLATLSFPAIAYSVAGHVVRSWIWPRWPRVFLPSRVIYGMIFAIVLFGVGRNLLS